MILQEVLLPTDTRSQVLFQLVFNLEGYIKFYVIIRWYF